MATSGRARMLRSFTRPFLVLRRMWRPSWASQTGVSWGRSVEEDVAAVVGEPDRRELGQAIGLDGGESGRHILLEHPAVGRIEIGDGGDLSALPRIESIVVA